MEIKLNGEARKLEGETTLAHLLGELKINPEHLAIEHNGEFLADDADYESVKIKPGDALEIVRFVGGG